MTTDYTDDTDFAVVLVPNAAEKSQISTPSSAQSPIRIEQVAPGCAVERPGGGAYWLIERRLSDIAPQCAAFTRRYGDLLMSEALILPEGTHWHVAEFAECNPCSVVYLDIETTGLVSGAPLFMIGLMEFDGRDFVIKQYFARNYAEECHLIAALAEHLPKFRMMVTFNGRRFDAPYIRDRATVNRTEIAWPPLHFDLLTESRRRWARVLPDCKLITLEQHVCRRRRLDDVPGSLIPAIYHEFVHTQDASLMDRVIHHNALDLLTMAELALFMIVGQNDWTV
ncbi:ribonuclease H-like domain-containing protein [Candidatus Sumerlaeota bacterium]|nr:ribonuclease H-like domain-containing protein [Candidatus Sumerlaeota bacterium]